MTTMTTSNGFPPYPKVTGMQTGGSKVATTPTEQDKMKCAVCGMTDDGNPAHDDDYKGPGQHSFKSATKSYGDDIFVASGGDLKSLGDSGEFEGLMISFDTVDLTRDAFSKSTDLFHKVGDSLPILYDHGLDKTLRRRQIGRAVIKSIDDVGVWIKGQLEQRDDYEKAIYTNLVKPGKAGLSSGAASHMVERKKSSVKKGINDIVAWGLAEVSITPRPTEPHTFVEVKSLAAYADEDFDDSHDFLKSVWEAHDEDHDDCLKHCGNPDDHVDGDPELPLKTASPGSTLALPHKAHEFDPEDDDPKTCAICGEDEDDDLHDGMKSLPPDRALKGIYEEELADQMLTIWQLRSALDKVAGRVAAAAVTSDISGTNIDVREKTVEMVTEYAARLIPLIADQIEEYVESQKLSGGGNSINGPMGFYLKSLPNDFNSSLQQFVALKSMPVAGEALDSHSARAVSAVEELTQLTTGALEGLKSWVKRVKDKIEFRRNDPVKAGRTISAATHNKLQSAHESVGTAVAALSEVHSHIGGLIEIAKRKPGDKPDERALDDVLDDQKSLSYTEIELMLATATSQTELALNGESL
jgi:hypothetical protein